MANQVLLLFNIQNADAFEEFALFNSGVIGILNRKSEQSELPFESRACSGFIPLIWQQNILIPSIVKVFKVQTQIF
ncbi:MAG: hypothetical protein QME06_02850 [Desulfobacterales bacterium]|nr:hypothetical protein [Desulfobacterales bacterium]